MITSFVRVHGVSAEGNHRTCNDFENLKGAIRSGGLFFSPVDGRYVESLDTPLPEFRCSSSRWPDVGIGDDHVGTWIGSFSSTVSRNSFRLVTNA